MQGALLRCRSQLQPQKLACTYCVLIACVTIVQSLLPRVATRLEELSWFGHPPSRFTTIPPLRTASVDTLGARDTYIPQGPASRRSARHVFALAPSLSGSLLASSYRSRLARIQSLHYHLRDGHVPVHILVHLALTASSLSLPPVHTTWRAHSPSSSCPPIAKDQPIHRPRVARSRHVHAFQHHPPLT